MTRAEGRRGQPRVPETKPPCLGQGGYRFQMSTSQTSIWGLALFFSGGRNREMTPVLSFRHFLENHNDRHIIITRHRSLPFENLASVSSILKSLPCPEKQDKASEMVSWLRIFLLLGPLYIPCYPSNIYFNFRVHEIIFLSD